MDTPSNDEHHTNCMRLGTYKEAEEREIELCIQFGLGKADVSSVGQSELLHKAQYRNMHMMEAIRTS